MLDCNYIVLYVAEPCASALFYAEIFKVPVTPSSENFAFFTLASGMQVGLHRRSMVTPPLKNNESLCELCIMVKDDASLDQIHDSWQAQNIKILEEPNHACFAYTFIAADPDGHRIRVCHPKEA